MCDLVVGVTRQSDVAKHVSGVLVLNKPLGPSSHDVVAVARRSLGVSRIGHTGTLDPQAAGVLPLVVGQATRLAQYLSRSDKEYEATIRFGIVTDSHDAAGNVVAESGLVPAAGDVEAALRRFRGTFEQAPPVYSAKMVEGERSYARARAGKPIQSAPVRVTVHALEVLSFETPRMRLRVRCTAGFYVRSLAHDLGTALSVGAILDGLVRTEAAGFALADALPFETLVAAPRAELHGHVRPMESLLNEVPCARLTAEGVEWAIHGRDLGPRQLLAPLPSIPALVRLMSPDLRLVGLADPSRVPGFLHPAVVFSYN
ncbi:MAG: tRNA pseudouridine(55) synthase TruB [Acidobacteria bacterium]|nr:tRNA pseudouridine(55) synthase TruB [Acidobacteriota bacterium]